MSLWHFTKANVAAHLVGFWPTNAFLWACARYGWFARSKIQEQHRFPSQTLINKALLANVKIDLLALPLASYVMHKVLTYKGWSHLNGREETKPSVGTTLWQVVVGYLRRDVLLDTPCSPHPMDQSVPPCPQQAPPLSNADRNLELVLALYRRRNPNGELVRADRARRMAESTQRWATRANVVLVQRSEMVGTH